MTTSQHRNVTFKGLGVEKGGGAPAWAAQGARRSPGGAPEPWGCGTEGGGGGHGGDLRGHFQLQRKPQLTSLPDEVSRDAQWCSRLLCKMPVESNPRGCLKGGCTILWS